MQKRNFFKHNCEDRIKEHICTIDVCIGGSNNLYSILKGFWFENVLRVHMKLVCAYCDVCIMPFKSHYDKLIVCYNVSKRIKSCAPQG